MLRVLGGEALSLRELADRLEMSSPAALKVIDAMVRDGYVERAPPPTTAGSAPSAPPTRGHAALAAARRPSTPRSSRSWSTPSGPTTPPPYAGGWPRIAGQATEVIPQVLRRSTAPR